MSTRVLNIALIYFAFILAPVFAVANPTSFEIGKTKVNILIPEGYCSLYKSETSDGRVLTAFDTAAKGKHKRLVFMVNCEQLTAWRNGDQISFDDFGYILLPEEYVNRNSDEDLDKFLNNMIDEIAYGRKNIIRHRGDGFLEEHIEASVVELEISRSVDLGLIHRDNLALYTASLDKITTETGEQKLTGKVTAITQVNGKPLFFYWFRALENIKTIAELESKLSQWIISVHLEN